MPKRPRGIEDRIRLLAKRLDYSIDSLETCLSENGGDFSGISTVRGITTRVRIIVRVRRPDTFYKWAMSVLHNNQRIDGIDWEPSIRDHRGPKHNCRGWHRHIWKQATTDTLKECVPEFNPKSIREFLVGGFRILNVQLKKEEGENARQMRFT